VLTSVILGRKVSLRCFSVLRGVPEVSLWCSKMSKYVLDEDASCPWDVFRSQGVSMRRREVSKGVSEMFMRCL
jgi:hypothetical protein